MTSGLTLNLINRDETQAGRRIAEGREGKQVAPSQIVFQVLLPRCLPATTTRARGMEKKGENNGGDIMFVRCVLTLAMWKTSPGNIRAVTRGCL